MFCRETGLCGWETRRRTKIDGVKAICDGYASLFLKRLTIFGGNGIAAATADGCHLLVARLDPVLVPADRAEDLGAVGGR